MYAANLVFLYRPCIWKYINLAITILNEFIARKFKLGSPYPASNKLTTINQSKKQPDKYVQINETKSLLYSYIKLESSDNSLLPLKDIS